MPGQIRRGSDVTKSETWPLLNYVAWPSYKDLDQIPEWKANLVGVCQLENVRPANFSDAEMSKFSADYDKPETRRLHADSLTEMRKRSANKCDLRVVWGGEFKRSKGWMPGILEEVYMTLTCKDSTNRERGKPLLILGGFGGCASKLADYLMCLGADWRPEDFDSPADTKRTERDALLTEAERKSQREVLVHCGSVLKAFRTLLWNEQSILDKTEAATEKNAVTMRIRLANAVSEWSQKLKNNKTKSHSTREKVNGIQANTVLQALIESRPREVTWLVMNAVEDVAKSKTTFRRKAK